VRLRSRRVHRVELAASAGAGSVANGPIPPTAYQTTVQTSARTPTARNPLRHPNATMTTVSTGSSATFAIAEPLVISDAGSPRRSFGNHE
jgi:hypothetical protein